jgi:hypothetical protein
MPDKLGASYGGKFLANLWLDRINPYTPSSIDWLKSYVDSKTTTLQEAFDESLKTMGESDGDVTMVDPFSGNLQEWSEILEPHQIHQCGQTHRPNKSLIDDSFFGYPVLTHNGFQRFNLWTKALRIISFLALQMRHNEFMIS